MTGRVEAALRRHRDITIAGLVLLIVLAWVWLLAGAGMGMDPLASLSPHGAPQAGIVGMPMDGSPMTQPGWTQARIALTFSMWWIMMVAMMLPSAAPTILLYSRALAHEGEEAVSPSTTSFLAGYLLAWGVFSLLAALLQMLLQVSDLLVPMQMASSSRWLSAAILIAAGVYQLSPLKDVCLRHCRSPARFLSEHYREGRLGALRMGLSHGTYCVGCCWLLMALLFVGGVMNLAWIALLTLMVAAEKLLPFGRYVARAAGIGCVAWGVIVLAG